MVFCYLNKLININFHNIWFTFEQQECIIHLTPAYYRGVLYIEEEIEWIIVKLCCF